MEEEKLVLKEYFVSFLRTVEHNVKVMAYNEDDAVEQVSGGDFDWDDVEVDDSPIGKPDSRYEVVYSELVSEDVVCKTCGTKEFFTVDCKECEELKKRCNIKP